jgi:hypothetical protein
MKSRENITFMYFSLCLCSDKKSSNSHGEKKKKRGGGPGEGAGFSVCVHNVNNVIYFNFWYEMVIVLYKSRVISSFSTTKMLGTGDEGVVVTILQPRYLVACCLSN